MDTILPTAAAVSTLVLAAFALVSRPRLRIQSTFALGMLGFAAECVIAINVLTLGDATMYADRWLRAFYVAGVGLLVPWALFVAVLADLQMHRMPRAWYVILGVGAAFALASAVAIAVAPAFAVAPGSPGSGGIVLLGPARFAAIVQLLVTVGILAGLEACLRTSRGANRRRVKYLVLGLGGIFLIRFYVLSQVLLFQTFMEVYVKTSAATLLLGNLFIALPITRDELRGAEITVSRQMLYRSVVVSVLGLYLFAVAVVGSLLTYLAIPEETFWASVVIFVSALGLAAVLLSDRLRWRLQRFIARHFYRSKYDYREQWMTFTKRLTPLLSAGEIGHELIEAITEASGATTGAVYLLEPGDTQYRLRGRVGAPTFPQTIAVGASLPSWLRTTIAAAPVPPALSSLVGDARLSLTIAAPLRWRHTVIGFIVLGPERSGAEYTIEDLEFLSTVAAQAAGSLATARLSESMAQARQLETFDRVTAAVIHDIKNCVGALSMLSRNALRNFGDPEFQRDTITTLSRTVDRMRRLLARLSSPLADTANMQAEPVDLAALIVDATTPLAGGGRVQLVRDLHPVGEIRGDREALLRVVENLVTNAIEAIDGDGVVTIRLRPAGERAVVSVADTGCGIAEDFLQRRLFSPFQSTKKDGWGVGLYNTKQVIDRHLGEITVETVVGQGTTFSVSLPLAMRDVATDVATVTADPTEIGESAR
jgi:putative PEP-CTERM system histidine kinase